MTNLEKPMDAGTAEIARIAADIRQDLVRGACPEAFVRIACAAAEQAVRAAEARERRRIVRWLKKVAQVYGERFRAGREEDTVYWFDRLEAFTHAAEAIARQRHSRPH